MELLPLALHLDECRGRGPSLAQPILEGADATEHLGGAHGVHVAERAPTEGGETQPEDRPDVAVPGAA